MADTEEGEAPVREVALASLSTRVGQQLGHVGQHGDGWLANGEELVDETKNAGKDKTQHPDADSGGGSVGIVVVVDNGTHFGVGTVVGDQSSLQLHLVDDILVLLRVVEDGLVAQELFDPLQNGVREIRVVVVDGEDVGHEGPDFFETHRASNSLGLDEVLLGHDKVTVSTLVRHNVTSQTTN